MNILILVLLMGVLGLTVLAVGVAIHYSQVEKQIGQNKGMIKDGDRLGVIKEASNKIRNINNQCLRLDDQGLVKDIRLVTESASNIIKEIGGDPLKVKRARKFLNYYLDATDNIITKYTNLSTKGIESHESVLNRVQPIVLDIKKGFDLEYSKLFDDELMDLNVEIEVLKTSIEQEIKG